MVLKHWLLVFAGGGFGSLFRYGLAVWMAAYQDRFPWATLLANILSCIILGVLLGLAAKNLISPNFRLIFMTGLCGGFSTFSTFAGETVQLAQQGRWESALLNIALHLAFCLFCLYLGMKLVD